MKSAALHYLQTMFATCMLFMALYSLCVALWLFFPDLPSHIALEVIFPGFKLLDVPSFCYGLVMSAIYGWLVAIVFVFFYNLWPKFSRIVFGVK